MISQSPEKRLHSVDALRGLAALLVVIYHARAEYWVGVSAIWAANGLTADVGALLGYATYPFSYGWFGVQLFFVLSGYCIHRRFAFELAHATETNVDWRRFFIRRLIRIYPVYIVALIATAIVDYLYLGTTDGYKVGEFSWIAFWASVFSLQGIFAPMFGTNTVFWTLSIEIHLYLFYPLLYIVNRDKGAQFALIFAGVISVGYVAIYILFDIKRFFPYAHAGGPIFLPFVFMWAAGAYLADVEAGRARLPKRAVWHIIWITALFGGFVLHVITDEVVSALPLAIGAAGIVYWLQSLDMNRLRIAHFLKRPFVALGVISYSFYATHRVSFGAMNALGFSGSSTSIIKFLIAVAVATFVAWLFYVVVERSALIFSANFRPKPSAVIKV